MSTARLTPVVRLAPAKLNLTLAVIGRRADGFHDLHSVFLSLALADRLSLAPSGATDGRTDTLHVTGPNTGPMADNLVLRGIAAARAAVGEGPGRPPTPPLAARLDKRIPVAAGLAGGSSDGAAAFDGALEAWGADLEPERRAQAAASIGSDVPFFLVGGPALIEGRGDRVTPLAAVRGTPGILLVTPDVAVRTPDVFAVFDAIRTAGDASVRMTSEHLAQELAGGLSGADLVARAGVLAAANDLLPAAILVEQGLVGVRRALTRTLGRPIGLSGSGPTLWALYPSEEQAGVAADVVRAALESGAIPAVGGQPHHHRIQERGDRDMTRHAVSTAGAPAAIGPYSQAIASGELVLCSGQLGLDPATGELVDGGVEAQAERALRNLTAVLDAAGMTFGDVVKTTVFLARIEDFAAVNGIYAAFMPDPAPARSTFAVGALPKGGLVEIEAIARRS
jgi:4-diphosphocytidyl-2C-methyl-D-erythritol kinase